MDVIYVDARPAGRLYVERTSKEIRLMDICLLPEFRKSGIGTYLMQTLIDDAKKDDLPISLHVEKNSSSKDFYDRLGFQVIEDRQTHWFMEYQP
jgi:ribosomal protein S18 acetylase RimI-like enzyme